MDKLHGIGNCLRWCAGALLLLVGMAPGFAGAETLTALKVTASDTASAATAVRVHTRARTVKGDGFGKFAAAMGETLSGAQMKAAALVASAATVPSMTARTEYPGDLFYLGGKTIVSAQLHNVFVNPTSTCPANGCWGDPDQFLADLGRSSLIHVTDQYTGVRTNHRYTGGPNYLVSGVPVPSPAFTDQDLLAVVHAAASVGGAGYGHMYNIFLTPGTDECFDSTFSVCYSPDNPATWVFCAYHSSADFADIGHVIYSIEPYTALPGCWVEAGTPNGRLVDSTNDVLSHETIEAVTDPDGDAWWNYYGGGMYGQEIGDECVFLAHHGDGSSVPIVFQAAGHTYAVQPEYDNSAHGCTMGED